MGSSDPYASAREHGLMIGTPPTLEGRVTRSNWFYAPYNRWAFSNATLLVPTAEVSRGDGPVRALPERLAPADEVEALTVVDHAGTERTVAEMLQRTWSDALVVLKDGEVVYERYDNDLRADQLHLLASVTKSFTGLLTLIAIDEGRLDPDRLAIDYVPELAAGVFGDTTVQQVLDMTVAAEWDELDWLAHEAGPDQVDSMFLRFLRHSGTWVDSMHETDKGLLEFAATLQKSGEHGETFMYLTPATDILGWLLARVYDKPYVELLAERIWSRIGAEHSGRMLLDPIGGPVASGGLNVTARDLARFGQMILDNGRVGDDQVVPESLVRTLRDGGSTEAFARCPDVAHMEGWSYRAQWWVTPEGHPTAWGVCGQILWVDHEAGIVLARLASAPDTVDSSRDVDETALCEAVMAHFKD
ncbi:serine hydrolase [Nocardioides sp. CN2-186]|uniref:serine hydrolase domain-containing protein n=1 Tax=Nocardioides tweenelious TaxID=3156607 RepID=UPI0032B358AB